MKWLGTAFRFKLVKRKKYNIQDLEGIHRIEYDIDNDKDKEDEKDRR